MISAEEFRKTAESVKLSFDDQEEEQLARKEVEEIVRFSQMVLSSSSSSSDGGGESNNSATRKDDGVEERAAERNGPTPRRRADESKSSSPILRGDERPTLLKSTHILCTLLCRATYYFCAVLVGAFPSSSSSLDLFYSRGTPTPRKLGRSRSWPKRLRFEKVYR